MNNDIKEGAKQLARGLKAEAKDVKVKIGRMLDEDGDGKVDFNDIKRQVVGDAKEGVDKLKALAADEKLSQNTKEEINKALEKIKPMVEAAKMEVEIKKEKIAAEVEHKKQIEEMKDEVEEASSFVEETVEKIEESTETEE